MVQFGYIWATLNHHCYQTMGPSVSQTEVTCPPRGWMGVGKISFIVKKDFYLPFAMG